MSLLKSFDKLGVDKAVASRSAILSSGRGVRLGAWLPAASLGTTFEIFSIGFHPDLVTATIAALWPLGRPPAKFDLGQFGAALRLR